MTRLRIESSTSTTVRVDGRELLYFGGCNYLGLHHHPGVLAATRASLTRYGISAGASRSTSGDIAPHSALERTIAAAVGTEDAVLFSSAHLANLALAQTLGVDRSIALLDAGAHPSLRDAVRAVGLRAIEYGGRDGTPVREILRGLRGTRVTVWTDGVFPVTGRVADVPGLLDAVADHRAWLVVDDAHGFGVMGRRGAGVCEGIAPRPNLAVTVTLSKAYGCAGGAVSGSHDLCEKIRARADAYRCTTPLPPALAAAGIAALRAQEDEPERLATLRVNIALLHRTFAELGFSTPSAPLPVVAVAAGTEDEREAFYRALFEAGFLVPLVSYPGGPAPSWFRVAVTAEHSAEEIDLLGEELRRLLGR